MEAQAMVSKIEHLLKGACDRQKISGASVAVAEAGKIIFTAACGFRNVDEQLPADSETIYNIASVTKQFTAAAILYLEERGRLRRSDGIERYFPKYRQARGVTLEQLMNHTSGVPDFAEVEGFEHNRSWEPSPEEVVELVVSRPLAFEPGTSWQYSNTTYIMLGRIIELASDQPYDAFLAQRIFDPLGLARTSLDHKGAILSNRALGYTSYCFGPLEHAMIWDPSWEYATGGLLSTVIDKVHWSNALRAGRVISHESFKAMSTSAKISDGYLTGYGLGLKISKLGRLVELQHGGGLPGFATISCSYPELELDLALFCSSDQAQPYYSVARPLALQLTNQIDHNEAIPEQKPFWASIPIPDAKLAQRLFEQAISGQLDGAVMSDDLVAFLTPKRRLALQNLETFGRLKSVQLVDEDYRDPLLRLIYLAEFDQQRLRGELSINTKGRLCHVGFKTWELPYIPKEPDSVVLGTSKSL